MLDVTSPQRPKHWRWRQQPELCTQLSSSVSTKRPTVPTYWMHVKNRTCISWNRLEARTESFLDAWSWWIVDIVCRQPSPLVPTLLHRVYEVHWLTGPSEVGSYLKTTTFSMMTFWGKELQRNSQTFYLPSLLRASKLWKRIARTCNASWISFSFTTRLYAHTYLKIIMWLEPALIERVRNPWYLLPCFAHDQLSLWCYQLLDLNFALTETTLLQCPRFSYSALSACQQVEKHVILYV